LIGLEKKRFVHLLPFIFLAIIYVIGLFIDVMDVDSAQYASMAREMLQTKSFLAPADGYGAYLDKPPLLFWLSSLSFYIFGISNFAFKLPSLAFAMLGIYSTYKLSKLYYSFAISYIAALVFASCQAFFLFTNDVRTDAMLTGCVIFAVWHIAAYIKTNKYLHFFAGFAGIAFAMMAKGPIGLVIPMFAFAVDFAMKRQWRLFFKWQWIIGLLFVLLLLSPMLYGLYTQFDLHPEKIVNGKNHISGIKFFFWTQSFGRITGESAWQDDSTPLFFFHSIAWAFLPWTVLLFGGIVRQLRVAFKNKFGLSANGEGLSIGAFILGFIALSLSHYKLPHYIFVVFPFAAIITARFIMDFPLFTKKQVNWLYGIQMAILLLLWGAAVFISTFVFPCHDVIIILISTIVQVICIFVFINDAYIVEKMVAISVITMFGVNFISNSFIYPELLSYEADATIGRWVDNNKISSNQFFAYRDLPHSLSFYSRRIVPVLWMPDNIDSCAKKYTKIWVRLDKNDLLDLKAHNIHFRTILELPDYPVSLITFKFIKPKTRESVLHTKCLIEVD